MHHARGELKRGDRLLDVCCRAMGAAIPKLTAPLTVNPHTPLAARQHAAVTKGAHKLKSAATVAVDAGFGVGRSRLAPDICDHCRLAVATE